MMVIAPCATETAPKRSLLAQMRPASHSAALLASASSLLSSVIDTLASRNNYRCRVIYTPPTTGNRGRAYFARASVRVVPHSRAVTDARTTTPPNSEDLAEYLDELRRINSARETNWARVFSALNDKIRHAADPALRRLRTGPADVLLRRRRV